MSVVKNKFSKSRIVLCGQGRIGSAVAKQLKQLALSQEQARIDPISGLIDLEAGLEQPIDILVICISARQNSQQGAQWSWREILLGLRKQIDDANVAIQQIVMVSSTRVYEGIEHGLVTASTPVCPLSEQAAGLIAAENLLLHSAVNTIVLRCSGLYGNSYSYYTPIMLAAKDKVRCGVNADQVVVRLTEIIEDVVVGRLSQSIELLTDGKVYYAGQQYDVIENSHEVAQLAESFRVLVASQFDC